MDGGNTESTRSSSTYSGELDVFDSRPSNRAANFRLDSDRSPRYRKSPSINSFLNVGGSSSSVSPLVPQRRSKNTPEWLTMDKLNLASLGLFERDQEISILKKCLEDISLGIVDRRIILVSGFSGTGKTSLANALRGPTTNLNGLFARGKFDLNNRHAPYSGVAMACEEICNHILSLQEKDLSLFRQVVDRIENELGSELPLLVKVIPALVKLTDRDKNDGNLSIVDSSSVDSKNRLSFAVQRFIRIVSDEFAPLVLTLDDLQWVDGSSLHFLESCLSDGRNSKFMVVGTYRSNEVDESHALHQSVTGLRAKSAAFEMTEISIGNLSVEGINNIIATLLSMERDTQTMGLAQVCFKKTQGNAFFVVQFLEMLRHSDLLKFDFWTSSWKWNNDEIDGSTSVTDNVVDLLNAKMEYLSNDLLEILKIVAFLGSTFKKKCLRYVWEALPNVLSDQSDIEETLNSGLVHLEQDGYIIKYCHESFLSLDQSFAWTHDKVQEAAIGLVAVEERAAFCYNAGDVLLSRLNPDELESYLFVVVPLLNAGEALVADNEKRVRLARLNYRASLRALSILAFESVAAFSAKGIKYLPENHWNDHYELSLDLYSIAARAEGCLGNVDMMERYCELVLSQKERPMEDKLLVYHTLVDCMISKGLVDKATDLLFNILDKCHCRFPQNPVLIRGRILASVSKMISFMKSHNPVLLAEMNNPLIIELTKLLDKLLTCLYMKGDIRVLLVVFRVLDWTMKYGYCEYSPVAFASIGVVFCGIFHDFRRGSWYGEQSLKLLERSRSSAQHSRTMFLVYSKIFMWTKPLFQMVNPLHHSYDVGLRSGDLVNAGWSIYSWLSLRYITGVPLGTLDHDCKLFCKQLKDLNQNLAFNYSSCVHQSILNLAGSNEGNPTVLIGEACTMEDHRRCLDNPQLSTGISIWQGALLTYFGDHVGRANLVLREGHDFLKKKIPSSLIIAFDTVMRAISCFAAARETGKRKYAKMGEKLRSQIKSWHERGNPNVTHYASFLDAESAVLKNKRCDAIRRYESTITFAAKVGLVHDAAFACERLAEFQLTRMGDHDEAVRRMGQSLGFWKTWEAFGKVKALEKKYPDLCVTTEN